MNKSKDPFEAAFEEQEESPPNSPIAPDNTEIHTQATPLIDNDQEDYDSYLPKQTSTTDSALERTMPIIPSTGKNKEDEEEDDDEEDNMDGELEKMRSSGDPHKMSKMQEILSQFTEEQMSRYESFRRSGFQKTNMKRLLANITGSQKISIPMTIVVSGIAKMFVGELIETARMVMSERNETGPIRPCHVREAYRRLKLEGKVPKKSIPRLFR